MRLNLGCGFKKLEDFVNVDKETACEPDRVVDLENIPWPFDDSCAEEVVLSHTLEHLGESRLKRLNREWQEEGFANTPLAIYLDVDFEVEAVELMPDEPWLSRLRDGDITSDALAEMVSHQNNIVREIQIDLRVVKD